MVSEDWVVRYQNRLLQLERPSRPRVPAKSRVLVRENQAGEVAIHYRDHRLVFRAPIPKTEIVHPCGGSSVEKKSLSTNENTDLFYGLVKTTTGHFYCGRDGDISNVV